MVWCLITAHGLGWIPALSLLARLAWITAELVHGSGHTLARMLVDRDRHALHWRSIAEQRTWAELLLSLLPLAPLLPLAQGATAVRGRRPLAWIASGDLTPWKVRLKAAAGPLFNLAASLCAAMLLQALAPEPPAALPTQWLPEASAPGVLPSPSLGIEAALWLVIAANGLLVVLSRTDLQSLCSGSGARLYCGNFGLISVPRATTAVDLLPSSVIQAYQLMGRETELRGSQAGGGLLLSQDRSGGSRLIGHKLVNAKRGDLTGALERGFRLRRRLARLRGLRPHATSLLACWHYRFGTSGPPAVRETHWLEWTPARRRVLYRQQHGRWVHRSDWVQHRITHNGDFEAIQIGAIEVDVLSDLGPWLERALQQPAPGVVDSARIAGMMDLMICQGDWWAAVRWGYLCTLARFPDLPSSAMLTRCSQLFEAAFLRHNQQQGINGLNVESWMPSLADRILMLLQADPVSALHPKYALQQWIEAAIDAFLHYHPGEAVRQFLGRARGSFGLVVVSTTQPDQLVLSSLGQPMTIGMDPQECLAVYASEPAAVDAVMAERPSGWRLHLDQNAGEIALLRPRQLELLSLSLQRCLSPGEWLHRQCAYRSLSADQLPLPASLRQRTRPTDPVAADLAEIPALLSRIRSDWSHPGSCNRQSAEAMVELLITKAENIAAKQRALQQAGLDPGLARSAHVDLLITGMENSLWLGEQFGRDLLALYPQITVRVESSNTVLNYLQYDIESLNLARQSIILILSHSGQTFPSRQVMEACDLLVRNAVIREFFLLVGETDSLLGSVLLASRRPGEHFSRRLFTTGAGRRRAEPATIAVVAMQQTLTELLFCLSRQLRQAFPDAGQQPLGLRLSWDQLRRLEEQENACLVNDCADILGFDPQARTRQSATSHRLIRAGRRWGQHVQETAIAWSIHAIYILISVEFSLPIVQTLIGSLLHLPAMNLPPSTVELGLQLAKAADVGVYVFGPWLWTLALRSLQGRALLARTGRRTIVIGESVMLHRLLANYVSKLFSLSYGIASVDVQADHACDQLLHTQAHRVVRGTLLFLGIPNGCSGGLLGSEARAVLLAGRQSDGIRHWGTGPELVAVGSDPSIRTGPFRSAILLPEAPPMASHGEGGRSMLPGSDQLLESLCESRYGSLRRLLASYLFFWAMARQVASLPMLRFCWWRSQSYTRIMTTAAPISAAQLDLAEPQEIEALSLRSVANREQS